jgi:hypothetical protein
LLAPYADHTADRGDVDDRAALAAALHLGDRILAPQPLASQIGVDDRPVSVVAHLVDRVPAGDARVVHQNVDRAEGRPGGLEGGDPLGFPTDVLLQELDPGAGREVRTAILDLGGDVGQHHGRALLGE